MVEGMYNSSLDFYFCEHYVYGKKNQMSFPSGAKRANKILELVHSDVFLGDDRKARIIECGKFKLKLEGGRIRTLPSAMHTPALARNLIYVSKMDDVDVKIVFKKYTCKMVQGELVLMQGVRIGTLYKL